MGRGRVTETELMPSLGVGYTELSCAKLKRGMGFSGPNFEPGPSLKTFRVGTPVVFLLNKSLVCT